MSKNDKNLPQLRNQLGDMIMGNMPGLPEIIQNAMPVEMPRASYKQNSVGLFFGNIKRNQLVKATKAEAEMAEASNRTVKAKLDTIFQVVTFSAKIVDTLGEYEYGKDLRRKNLEVIDARLKLLNLEAQEKEANIQQTQYKTALIAQEVEMSKLDHKIKVKQMKEILNDEDDVIDA
jgi:hypothetical protein